MNILNIIDFKEEDIKDVVQIEKTSFFSNWNKQMFMDSFFNKNHFFKIAVYDNKIIGYIIYSIIFDESEILNIVVDSSYRGKTFGIQLLNYTIEDIKNKKCLNVFLEVAKKNIIAKNLYLKFGFVEYNIRKNYYKNDDAVLMKKVVS